MDLRWQPTPIDTVRDVQLMLFAATDTHTSIWLGVATALVDLSQFTRSLRQTKSELRAALEWHAELDGANMPRRGQFLAVYIGGSIYCVRPIAEVSGYSRTVGKRSISVTARSRDAFPAWRSVPRTTQAYPQGTALAEIARDVAESVGLLSSEILFGSIGGHTPQSSAQLSQVSAWTMLEQLLLGAGASPTMDALGRLKTYSRDIFRASDIVLDDDRVIGVGGSRAQQPITRLLLKWRDPELTMTRQQDRALASATITAGFFKLQQEIPVYWSEDRRQRALNTRLVIRQSANAGLLPVCIESYSSNGYESTGGTITLTTLTYVPTMVGAYVLGKLALALIPEPVVTEGVIVSAGVTVPEYGRYVEAGNDIFILMTMLAMGQGNYEVWGTPYDYVNAVNQTEAYDPDAADMLESADVIETDFAHDEGHAQAIVRREFAYRVRSSSSFSLTAWDDLRIEEGDIVETADGERLFVVDFDRDLTPGAPAKLELQGFPA